MKIAFKDSKILMISGRTLTPVPGQGPEPGLHYVYTSSEGHGSISASPMSGKKDTLITLSNTPDQNYIFSKYTLNNVDLQGSSFLMPDEDAYVRGYFQPDVRTITVTQPSHGTITAPASAQIGSTVTLSCTPDTGYDFEYFTVDGVQIVGNTFTMPASDVTVSASLTINYNPLNLPERTVRIKMQSGRVPSVYNATVTAVTCQPDVYDVTTNSNSWSSLFRSQQNLLEVLGANSTGVIDMTSMFSGCYELTSVALFDTSNITSMWLMFNECYALVSLPLFDTGNVTDMTSTFKSCSSLTSIPLFNTSNVTIMSNMCKNCAYLTSIPLFNTNKVTDMSDSFSYCNRVETGALALYQQASSQTNPPRYHNGTFNQCGTYTTTGYQEYQQIPSSWR